MPIEFRCQQCQNLLRTPDAAAGKKARCPQCGTIQDVPAKEVPQQQPAAPKPVPQPQSTVRPPSQKPLAQVKTSGEPAPAGAPQNPFADRMEANPYAAPTAALGYTSHIAQDPRRKVMGPSIALIVTSALAMLVILLISLAGVFSVAENGADEDDIVAFIMCGTLFLVEAFICIGGVLMLMMKSHSLGLAASVISVIPCTVGWCIRFPFGIWALIVLFDSSVRSAFR